MAGDPKPNMSALFRLAIISGSPASVLLHLDRGANVNGRDIHGATPLTLAVSKGRPEICRLLLERGADPQLVDNSGKSALDYLVGAPFALPELEAPRPFQPSKTEHEFTALPDGIASPAARDFQANSKEPLTYPRRIEFPSGSEAAIDLESSQKPQVPYEIDLYPEPRFPSESEQHDRAQLNADDSPWEAEKTSEAPPDDARVRQAAVEIQGEVATFRAINSDESWNDVEIDLPVRGPRLLIDRRRVRENARLRRLFRRILYSGLYTEASVVACIETSVDPRQVELDQKRLHAARQTALALGIEPDPFEDWVSAGSDGGPVALDTELDEAEDYNELLCSANDGLEVYMQEVASRPVPTRAVEESLWQRFDTALPTVWRQLLNAPPVVELLLLRFTVEQEVHEFEATQLDNFGEEEDRDEDLATSETAKVSGWSVEDRLATIALLGRISEEPDGQLRHTLRREVGDALRRHRLPPTFAEYIAQEALRHELASDVREGITASLHAMRSQRSRLVEGYLRLVIWIARKYGWSVLPLQDRIQEGNIGLLKAVDRFDPARGVRFTTYAVWWIRQSISRAIQDQGRTIRLPVHVDETMRRLERARQDLVSELGRDPNPSELADRLVISLAAVKRLAAGFKEPESLETPIGDEEDSHLGDFIEDKNAILPIDAAIQSNLRETTTRVLASLTLREERVLRMRFGIGMNTDYTLEEVGQQFGVTRERIRQIEEKALRKLKHPSRSRKLRSFLDA
jgi:RNA polymerase sigma factor (sigma-70 family)